jgi:hypothetical protein
MFLRASDPVASVAYVCVGDGLCRRRLNEINRILEMVVAAAHHVDWHADGTMEG